MLHWVEIFRQCRSRYWQPEQIQLSCRGTLSHDEVLVISELSVTTHLLCPPRCPPVGPDLGALRDEFASHPVGGHLLASPQPAWVAWAQTMSPRESSSALDALEGIPQRLRHRPPFLNPDTVVKAQAIHEVEDPKVPPLPTISAFSRSSTCGMVRKCSKCRIVGAGQVGRKRSGPTPPTLRWTLAKPVSSGEKKRHTHQDTL